MELIPLLLLCARKYILGAHPPTAAVGDVVELGDGRVGDEVRAFHLKAGDTVRACMQSCMGGGRSCIHACMHGGETLHGLHACLGGGRRCMDYMGLDAPACMDSSHLLLRAPAGCPSPAVLRLNH